MGRIKDAEWSEKLCISVNEGIEGQNAIAEIKDEEYQQKIEALIEEIERKFADELFWVKPTDKSYGEVKLLLKIKRNKWEEFKATHTNKQE